VPEENMQFNLLLIIFAIFKSSWSVSQGRKGEADCAVQTQGSCQCQFRLWSNKGLIWAQCTGERRVVITWHPDSVAVCSQTAYACFGAGVFLGWYKMGFCKSSYF